MRAPPSEAVESCWTFWMTAGPWRVANPSMPVGNVLELHCINHQIVIYTFLKKALLLYPQKDFTSPNINVQISCSTNNINKFILYALHELKGILPKSITIGNIRRKILNT